MAGAVAILHIIWITFLPFLELRASIPVGFALMGTSSWLTIAVIAIAANFVLGILLFYIADICINLLTRLRFMKRIYDRTIERVQKKAHKGVEKYGVIGLALFVGVPLPGSGVYSGVLAAKIFGIRFRDYAIAIAIGVLLAGAAVTLVMLTGASAFSFLIKT
ncbi:MAG: COG2426 family protein [Nanoarchaeota archaeon]